MRIPAPGPPSLALALTAGFALLLSGAVPSSADLGGEPAPARALTDVRIVAAPGTPPLLGTIVLRDGRIEAIGADVRIPPDAIVHPLPGRTVYAGLIEPYLRLSVSPEAGGVAHGNPKVRPELRAVDALPLAAELLGEMREAGFTTAHVALGAGIFRGRTAVVSLGDGAGDEVLVPELAQSFAFERSTWTDRRYPNSLMGAIALTRQSLLDADWHQQAVAAWSDGEAERPEENVSLRALLPLLEGNHRLWMETEDVRMLPRATALAVEFGISPVLIGGKSDEYERIDVLPRWLRDSRASLVITLAFPEAPAWEGDEERVAIELDALLAWERAPGNPAALDAAGIEFAVTTQGLAKRADFRARLREAIRAGLPPGVALAALTTRPAALLGLEERLGTIAPGKDANLVVTTGDLFAEETEIEEVWIDGVRHGDDPRRATRGDVARIWDLEVGRGEALRTLRIEIEEEDGTLVGHVVPDADADGAGAAGDADADPETDGPQAGPDADSGAEPPPGLRGLALARGTLELTIPGEAWAGDETRVTLRRDGPFLSGSATVGRSIAPVLARPVRESKAPEPLELVSAGASAWPPVYDPADRPSAVLVRNATIWTCGPEGTLEGADLLVRDGRIREVGPGLEAPKEAVIIDGTGLHVTPGLIDCHSHSSITGGVNECTNSATSEVRIADVVNPKSSAMYRELAGGLTVANLLHGSCNVIGGQNAVVKLKWGRPAEELLFEGAPPGIKFALGENVKQSNWDLEPAERTRYPQTRMGVHQFLRERFLAAADYRRARDDWRRSKKGAPPRPDLQLDALVEILDGQRLVHCHSYRADEIIVLIRVAEEFGFTVGTFQHVLEGYKAADEIAAHGAGASAFSDWWSYKYEVVDAIPYNGEIMWRRGVNVSFNSDSAELSRRMNLEAAKAVKYGGVPEEEALRFVTWNPAVQLGIADRVGSLEPGKDGDFVIWSAHPLSDFAVALETWIEGTRHFSRENDLARREAALGLRERLLAKAEGAAKAGGGESEEEGSSGPGRSAFGVMWAESENAHLARGECVESCCGEEVE